MGRKDYLKKYMSDYRKTDKFKQSNKESHNKYYKTGEGKDRIRRYQLKKFYGISLEDYNKLLEKQNGVCAICGMSNKTKKHLAVDHNHITGKVRGLLCSNCNRGLGLLGDNIPSLEKTIIYISNN